MEALGTELGKMALVMFLSLSGVVSLVVILAKVIRPRNGNGSSPTSQDTASDIRRIEARQATIEQKMTNSLAAVVIELHTMTTEFVDLRDEVRDARGHIKRIDAQLSEKEVGTWQRSKPSNGG